MTTPQPPADLPVPVPRPPIPGDAPPLRPLPPGPVPPQPRYGGTPMTGFAAPPQGYGPSPVYYPPQIPVSPSGHRLAEFSDRLLARLIDGAILAGVSAILVVPIYLIAIISLLSSVPTRTTVNGQVVSPDVSPAPFLLGFLGVIALVLVLSFAINYIYDVEMMFRSGQTVGKRVMKIRVLPVDPSVVLTRKMAFKRYLVVIATAFVPGLGWVDGLWQLWDKPWRQCLHDKFAQTLVIKLNP